MLSFTRKSLTSVILITLIAVVADLIPATPRRAEFEFSCPIHRPSATCCKAVLTKLGQEFPVECIPCKNVHLLFIISQLIMRISGDWSFGLGGSVVNVTLQM